MNTNTKALSSLIKEQEKEIKTLRDQLNIVITVSNDNKCLPCILKFLKIKK